MGCALRLLDIIDYQLLAFESLAVQRGVAVANSCLQLLSRGRKSPDRADRSWGFVIPSDQRDPGPPNLIETLKFGHVKSAESKAEAAVRFHAPAVHADGPSPCWTPGSTRGPSLPLRPAQRPYK